MITKSLKVIKKMKKFNLKIVLKYAKLIQLQKVEKIVIVLFPLSARQNLKIVLPKVDRTAKSN